MTLLARAAEAADGTRYIAGYLASAPAAMIATGGYGLVAAILWLHYARNGRKYLLTICIGATGMTIGYGIRIYTHWEPDSIPIFSAMTLFILVSPCLFLALDYMLLARMAVFLDAGDALPIRASRLSKVFVTADVVTFIAQLGAGGMLGMATSNPDLADIGTKAMIGGLIVQASFFVMFTIILIVWGSRVRSRYPEKWDQRTVPLNSASPLNIFSKRPVANWRILYYTILVTCVLYILRSIYRVVEYWGGHGNAIMSNETLFYVGDTIPILIAIALFTIVWPPRYLDESLKTPDNLKEAIPLRAHSSNPFEPGTRYNDSQYDVHKMNSGQSGYY